MTNEKINNNLLEEGGFMTPELMNALEGMTLDALSELVHYATAIYCVKQREQIEKIEEAFKKHL